MKLQSMLTVIQQASKKKIHFMTCSKILKNSLCIESYLFRLYILSPFFSSVLGHGINQKIRPLIREGALHEETRTCQTEETLKSGHGPQKEARHQEELAD
jgi:hypothetical protein